jgi:hypothetical protein
MNPTIELILTKNAADIEAIVAKIGLPTLIALIPNFLAIVKTIEATPAQPASGG